MITEKVRGGENWLLNFTDREAPAGLRSLLSESSVFPVGTKAQGFIHSGEAGFLKQKKSEDGGPKWRVNIG